MKKIIGALALAVVSFIAGTVLYDLTVQERPVETSETVEESNSNTETATIGTREVDGVTEFSVDGGQTWEAIDIEDLSTDTEGSTLSNENGSVTLRDNDGTIEFSIDNGETWQAIE